MSTMSQKEKMSNTRESGVGSNPEARNSGMKSPPNNSNADEGMIFLNGNLRSVLTNRMFFEVFVFINQNLVDVNKNGSQINYEFLQSIIPQKRAALLSEKKNPFWNNDQFQNLLSAPVNNKNNTGETAVTRQMVQDLRERMKRRHDKMAVYATGQTGAGPTGGYIVWDEGNLTGTSSGGVKGWKPPRLDVSIGLGNRLLAFVEVGVTPTSSGDKIDQIFSEKMAQAHKYVKGVFSNGGAVWKTIERKKAVLTASRRPILFSVLVFSKDRSIGRMAIFAAEPKPDEREFRVALIWRKEASSNGKDTAIADLDRAYGAFIHAVEYSATSFKNDGDDDQNWKYLGPDCVKVQTGRRATSEDMESYVLRVYDNRVRSTSRSPYLYLNDNNPLKDDYSVEKVLTFVDGGDKDVLQFGKKPISDDPKAQGWMLFGGDHVKFKGQVQIIAVRYHEGEHVCRNIGQAYDIVDKVAKLHEKNLVHGDIRGCNLIFSDEGSFLIDLDFGGKVGEVIYPPGYEKFLPDGSRAEANDGRAITLEHDLLALWSVLFEKHRMTRKGEKSLLKAAENNPHQHKIIQNFVGDDDDDDDEGDEIMSIKDHLEFLQLANELNREARFRLGPTYKTFLDTLKAGSSPEDTGQAGIATAPAGVLGDRMKKKKRTPVGVQFSPFGLLVKASPKHFLPVKRPCAED